MTGPIVDTHVNQAHFAWRPDGGLRLVASSYLDPPQIEKWSHRLQNHVRIYPVPGTPLPTAAFSYLVFEDGSAAWVRRATAGISEGRNNSLALSGRADVLDFPAAIGLSLRQNWSDEPPAGGQTAPVRASFVRDLASHADDLLSRVRDYEEHVTFVLAGVLANPAAPLSVIGGVEPERLAIVWALHRIAKHYLPQRFRNRRNWSFSTYEDRHDTGAGDLPGIVFLPAPQPGAGAINRIIIDLDQPRVDPADLAFARQVVGYLVHDRLADDSIVDIPIARPQPNANGATGAPTEPQQPEPIVPGPRPEPVSASPERSPVANLLRAQAVGPFVRELRRLEDEVARRGAVLHPYIDLATIDKLTEFVEGTVRYEIMCRLLRLLYGRNLPNELRDATAEKHAVNLIRRGKSDQLARMLGAAAPPGNRIRDAAFDRWAAGAGKPPAETVGQLSRQWRAARHSRWFRWVIVGAAAVAAALVFLLGYLYGRPDNAAAAQATPAATTKATQAPQTTAQDNRPTDQGQNGGDPGAGEQPSVQIHTDQGMAAWIFQKVSDDEFVLLAPCQQLSEGEWTCTKQHPANGVQVAIAIPSGIDLTPRVNQKIPRGSNWGKPQTIG